MVKIILNKQDIQNILSWAGTSQVVAENTKVRFEEDEFITLKKIKKSIKEK